MRLEHTALAMADPAATADWYARHLGFRVVRSSAEAPHAHFLLPPGGGPLLELFRDRDAPPLDYGELHPMQLHLAFAVDDVDAEVARLVAAGAVADGGPARSPAGDRYAIVRDPWGVPLQLITRAVPFEAPPAGSDA